ncbi:kynureninase [Microbacterium sp. YY-01]|uniref:kynureninase n=1 Tax=Microbacterium sp. YY-01 TaxID=3421634 RepID=UPI003D17909E
MTTDATLDLSHQAQALDEADPLAALRNRFAPMPGVTAYLDGNSLGRPLVGTAEKLADFVRHDWGTRLIRSWDEQWMALPEKLGNHIARTCLGAASGQTIVAESTSIVLYKLMRAALDHRPAGRDEVIIERGNFPTDRFLLEGIAQETGCRIVWVDSGDATGATAITTTDLEPLVSPATALVVLSHVDYRSGAIADMPAITTQAHAAGALVLWDLCHSVGALDLQLDTHGVDMAVGCTYKYLCGGPGSPAFGYLAERHHGTLQQPIYGWWGAADIFAMADSYTPAPGIRQMLSGTPPVTSMLAVGDMLDLIDEAGMPALRTKSLSLTAFAVDAWRGLLQPLGVRLLSPTEADKRGSHITIGHPDFRRVTAGLWQEGVIPDFRNPDGIRLGLSPLSTSHREVLDGVTAIARHLAA